MKKQKIEDIFSSMEKFSSVPPPELWNNIEEKLHKPKKKKTTIIWWSIAASLLIGLSIPSALYFHSDSETLNHEINNIQNNSVVNEENNYNSGQNKTRSIENNTLEETIKTDKNAEINVVSAEEKKLVNSDNNPSISNQNKAARIVSNDKKDWNRKTNHYRISKSKQHPNSNLGDEENVFVRDEKDIADNQNAADNILSSQQNDANLLIKNKKEIAGNQNTADNILSNQQNLTDKKIIIGNSNQNQTFHDFTFKNKLLKSEETIAFSVKNKDSKNVFDQKEIASNKFENFTNAMDKNNEKLKTENSETEKAIAINSGNKSQSHILSAVVDSVQLTELQNLEKSLASNSETKKEEDKKTVSPEKWSLEVFAGVANSENLGKDKTLGSANQSKQTNSYGVKTNYKLNKKWAVSSGLKINELGQSVANVSYINNQQALSYPSTSDYLNQSSVLVKQNITNNSAYVFVPNNTKNSLKSDNLQTGNIDQSLKYIEMPLEVSYAIFNKNKTSISLNTGGFIGKLISNNISLDGNSIGDNLEANDFVYGSLLSSTLQYRLYKKTHIFVEPGMNYYLNPLNNQSFNQFQWAFNFGLNVSF